MKRVDLLLHLKSYTLQAYPTRYANDELETFQEQQN